MDIRIAKKDELVDLIPLYKQAFPKHNIFEKEDNDVQDYLESREGEFIIALEGDVVVGVLLIVVRHPNKNHTIARFKHIAVDKEYRNKGVGTSLIEFAEDIVKKGKIEIHVSETEKDALDFYKENDYKIEGELKSHYRKDENCYILGKVI